MANFKRHKTKRNVRCTLCTNYRWIGNGAGRRKLELSAHRDREKIRKAIKDEL